MLVFVVVLRLVLRCHNVLSYLSPYALFSKVWFFMPTRIVFYMSIYIYFAHSKRFDNDVYTAVLIC